jgi:8-oxo-dGTP pyrophosphatase MutT (NUDIX family)
MKEPAKFKLNPDEAAFDAKGPDNTKATRPRDAATLILVRDKREVMMGQRAKGHVFMPDKWVFPGGRVDPGDVRAPAAKELRPEVEALLKLGGGVRRAPRAFALAAVRETKEEAGLVLGNSNGPDLSKLDFVARAITPPHRPRRFDARFFMADAHAVGAQAEPEPSEELLHTKWFTLGEAAALDLPSITRFVLKEVQARLAGEPLDPPFLRFSRGGHHMDRLKS